MNRDVIQLYDRLAEKYLLEMFTGNRWTRELDRREKELVGAMLNLGSGRENSTKKVIDLGMGPGRWSQFFLHKGLKHVSGVDISTKMVKIAKKNIKLKNFTARVANMEKLPFKADYFDIVFCFRSFKYVNYPHKAISEMYRTVKPNGKILLELPNNSLQIKLARLIFSMGFKKSRGSKYLRLATLYSLNEIKSLLQKSRLRLISIRSFALLPAIPLPDNLFWVWVVIEKCLFPLVPKKWFARSWILILSKNDEKN